MKAVHLLSIALLTCAALTAQDALPPLMPWPAQITRGQGTLLVNDGVQLVAASSTPRLDRAFDRFRRRFEARTGIPLPQAGGPAIDVRFARQTGDFPKLGDDESYRLEVRSNGARLEAATDLGVLRGLETALQLIQMTGQGWTLPAVTIEDRPRFPWRGLLLDVSRHWLGMESVKRTLDGMAVVKMNVLHWHLTDDQGFRVESRRYPKLQGMGSDGLYFTQAQVKEILAYAADRGIRVMPEFEMPGHATSWFVGYPEMASMPGPYQLIRGWGIFDPVMDPTRETTYEILGGFFEEMAALFPDEYVHIGGDEVKADEWNKNPAIVEFRKKNGIPDNHALQARFNQRLLQLITRTGKKMTGWDDILHPQLPKDILVQSWRDQKTLAAAVKQGYRSMLSTGFYLDLMQHASTHYAVEPFEGPGAGLSEEEKARVLGGEACMWAEFAPPEMLDARVWPRGAAIAERLWSPQSVRDVDSMYRRMEAVSGELERAGLTHRMAYERMLERLAGPGPIGPVRTLAEVVEPVKNYQRNATRKYFQSTPLNRMVDTAKPESERARQFGRIVKRYVESRQPADADRIRRALERWRDNDRALAPVMERSALLAELKPVSAALRDVAQIGLAALDGRTDGAAEGLKAAEKPGAELLISILPHVRALAMAPRPSTQAAPLRSAAPIPYKVADKFIPAPFEAQQIGGFLGERMRVNQELRLLRVDEPALLAGFQTRPGKQAWIGEHIGKFLHAATNTWRYTKDERLKTMMDRMVRELLATQMPDGYLGTYTDDQRWTSWDVWVHKYDLIGLLSYYEATGYQPALDASRKIGDLLIRTFGDEPGKRDIIAASTHVGMAATSILEPVCYLYRLTGDRRYLAFAEYLVRSWDQPNGPKIVNALLSHGSVAKTANGKAYEMMSCLVGLVEMYRLTGEPRYLKAAQTAWEDIRSHRLYITGTTSSHEHFQDDYVLPGLQVDDVGEGCATVTWLQLGWQLLRVTGEQKYAEELERTVYNQLLGAQDPRTGNICYFTPLMGAKNATPGINCCVSSEPRGISMIPQIAWGTDPNGAVTINLYAPGKLSLPGKEIVVKTDFPETGRVSITVNAAGDQCLQLRVPEWTSRFTARVGGERLNGARGATMRICRTWKPGETVEVDMDMTLRTLTDDRNYPGQIAFQRGPEVLALDAAVNPELPGLDAVAVRSEPRRVSERTYRSGSATLVPFSDAQFHRVWLRKTPAGAPVALTAFGNESWSRAGRETGSIADGRTDTFRSTNRGTAAAEDWFAVEMPRPQSIGRVVYTPGPVQGEGGGFAETPRIEFKRAADAPWEKLGDLTGNELRLDKPVTAIAIRVIGKPAGYVTCAELAAYAK